MPRPEDDPDEHDAQHDDAPREQVVRQGNPGVPQGEYAVDADPPPPGPSDPHPDAAPGPTGHSED